MSKPPTDQVHFVVVVADGGLADLGRMLASLEAGLAGADVGEPFLTVVDNTTEGIPVLRTGGSRRWLTGIRPESNLGYGAAVNLARRRLANAPPWIAACNADLVFEPDWPERLIEALGRAEPDVGLLAPRLRNVDGSDQPSVGPFPTLANLLAGRLRSRVVRKYGPTPGQASDVDWATGACLLIRTAVLDQIGGFDEGFFLDYEDTDLCRRLADRGLRRRFDPAWSVVHTRPNASRPPNPVRLVHSRASLMRYFAKHRPAWELRALATMTRVTLAVRSSDHPFAPCWRSGLEAYRQLRSVPIHP